MSVVVFDVNETLLSLEPVRKRLAEVFGTESPTGEWFARLLHGSLVANEISAHRPFSEIGVEALLTVAAKKGVTLTGETAQEIVGIMDRLPAHPEVYNALEKMFDAGLTMIALTNGSTASANAQIESAGLHIFLQRVVSVEEVGLFKPAAEVYHHAAKVMGVTPDRLTLVAAHDWDCAGAMAAGADAVFVRRAGVVWSLPIEPPPRVVADIAELATRLTEPS